jgi:hypothetical protein
VNDIFLVFLESKKRSLPDGARGLLEGIKEVSVKFRVYID